MACSSPDEANVSVDQGYDSFQIPSELLDENVALANSADKNADTIAKDHREDPLPVNLWENPPGFDDEKVDQVLTGNDNVELNKSDIQDEESDDVEVGELGRALQKCHVAGEEATAEVYLNLSEDKPRDESAQALQSEREEEKGEAQQEAIASSAGCETKEEDEHTRTPNRERALSVDGSTATVLIKQQQSPISHPMRRSPKSKKKRYRGKWRKKKNGMERLISADFKKNRTDNVNDESEGQEESTQFDLMDKIMDSMDRLLRTANSAETYATVENAADERFHHQLLHPNSTFYEMVKQVKLMRIPWAQPLFISNQNCDATEKLKNLKIVSWNAGKTKRTLVRAGLAILMNLLKIDVIMIQEVKDLQFNFYGSDNYNIICLPANAETSRLKRGLFIMYRNDLADSFSNPRGRVGRFVQQTDGTLRISNGDIEINAVDVQMQHGDTKLINLYRGGQKTIVGTEHLGDMLSPYLEGKVLLMGDANVETYIDDLAKKLKKPIQAENILPKLWETHYQVVKGAKLSCTQPDIIFSNIEKKNIVVHKPIDPHELVNLFRSNDVSAKSEAIKSVEQLCREYENDSKEHHYILLVELGENINKGNEIHCCPAEKSDTTGQSAGTSSSSHPASAASAASSSGTGTMYHCSKSANNCLFYKVAKQKLMNNTP